MLQTKLFWSRCGPPIPDLSLSWNPSCKVIHQDVRTLLMNSLPGKLVSSLTKAKLQYILLLGIPIYWRILFVCNNRARDKHIALCNMFTPVRTDLLLPILNIPVCVPGIPPCSRKADAWKSKLL